MTAHELALQKMVAVIFRLKKLSINKPYEAVTSLVIGYPKGKIDTVITRDTPPVEWIEG